MNLMVLQAPGAAGDTLDEMGWSSSLWSCAGNYSPMHALSGHPREPCKSGNRLDDMGMVICPMQLLQQHTRAQWSSQEACKPRLAAFSDGFTARTLAIRLSTRALRPLARLG